MSDPKCISPMLDGFALGSPISEHDGVKCCPAIRENSNNKYIVKTISVPASQTQLDALLLTGAYKDPADAVEYFKVQAEEIRLEAELLRKLAKLDGFLPYENWQIEPMDNNTLGYDVYLVGSYKRSLEKFMRRNPMTHLLSLNLALDICAALVVARRAGYIYVDLKPTNIFMSNERKFRIGDLGFMSLAQLKYSSLPAKYKSKYTAPELRDPLTIVNTTVDTYALGMILYRIYNNDIIPTIDPDSEDPLPTPANADPELADIILKAVSPIISQRYSDPAEMGHDLVSYMQRNRVNDTPVTPSAVLNIPEEMPPLVQPVQEEQIKQESLPESNETPAEISADAPEITEDSAADNQETPETEAQISENADVDTDDASADLEASSEMLSPLVQEDSSAVLDPISQTPVDTELNDIDDEEDLMDFLSMGDLLQEEREDDSSAIPKKEHTKQKKAKSKKRVPSFFVFLIILSILATGAFFYYQNFYLQTINSIQADGDQDRMVITLDTQIENSLLTVICSDTYGNSMKSQVVNNTAEFSDLLPGTLYKIKIQIDGFHALNPRGVLSYSFTTSSQMKIVSLSAKTGPENGSVVINFAVEGARTDDWRVIFYTDAGERVEQFFSGNMVTITGLTIGSTYTFKLEPANDLLLIGDSTITFTASSIVMAENLEIVDYTDNSIVAKWSTPEGQKIGSWTVRCYSESGYDTTVTTDENTATFNEIDPSMAYTLEVLAAGMTQPARTAITANPYHVTNITVDSSDEAKLVLNWDNDGDAPEEGWILKYAIDGSSSQSVLQCVENTAVIEPRIPGAHYVFRIESTDGKSVFDNVVTFDCPNAKVFSDADLMVSAEDINSKLSVKMLPTPEKENWSYKEISKNTYTSVFSSGSKASVLLHLDKPFWTSERDVTVLYVIRDSNGNVLPEYISQQALNWQLMWTGDDYHYCELNIPTIPTESGEYGLYLYFNNAAIAIVKFTVTQ